MENGADAHAFVAPPWKHSPSNGQEYNQAFFSLAFFVANASCDRAIFVRDQAPNSGHMTSEKASLAERINALPLADWLLLVHTVSAEQLFFVHETA